MRGESGSSSSMAALQSPPRALATPPTRTSSPPPPEPPLPYDSLQAEKHTLCWFEQETFVGRLISWILGGESELVPETTPPHSEREENAGVADAWRRFLKEAAVPQGAWDAWSPQQLVTNVDLLKQSLSMDSTNVTCPNHLLQKGQEEGASLQEHRDQVKRCIQQQQQQQQQQQGQEQQQEQQQEEGGGEEQAWFIDTRPLHCEAAIIEEVVATIAEGFASNTLLQVGRRKRRHRQEEGEGSREVSQRPPLKSFSATVDQILFQHARNEKAKEGYKRPTRSQPLNSQASVANSYVDFLQSRIHGGQSIEQEPLEEHNFWECWEVFEELRGHINATQSHLTILRNREGYLTITWTGGRHGEEILKDKLLHQIMYDARYGHRGGGPYGAFCYLHSCHKRNCCNPLHIIRIGRRYQNYNKYQLYIIPMLDNDNNRVNCLQSQSMLFMEACKEYILFDAEKNQIKTGLGFSIEGKKRWDTVKPKVLFVVLKYYATKSKNLIEEKIKCLKERQHVIANWFLRHKVQEPLNSIKQSDNILLDVCVLPKIATILETLLIFIK